MNYFSPHHYYYRQPVNFDYSRVPKQVKANLYNMPIFVNGKDINKPPYPALSYQPADAQNSNVYVPIAQFSKVGAKIEWSEETLTPNVTSTLDPWLDPHHNATRAAQKAASMAYREISKAVKSEEDQNKVRFNGMMDDKYIFDGIWWEGFGEFAELKKDTITIGKYYTGITDATITSTEEDNAKYVYLIVINDKGEQIAFRKSLISLYHENV
jgi:hypothetical protein